jgi:mono/diheme cytochrome c family protein
MPRWLSYSLMILAALALVPPAWIVRSRALRSPLPRLHIIQDMDNQGRYGAQQGHPGFADRRAMRLPVAGTISREQGRQDDHYDRGRDGEGFATDLPVPLTAEMMQRGRERFDIFCSPCHGLAGHGDGIVSVRAEANFQGGWVPPVSLHDEPALSREAGHLFNTISQGIHTMPAYRSQIPVADRWAIVAYVRALQRSQRASLADVPVDRRSELSANLQRSTNP